MLNASPTGAGRTAVHRVLAAYLVTMRPYLLFVSGITGIVALSFEPDTAWQRATLIVLASFFSYGFGQALTDCFQTDTDALSAPYRPLVCGIVSRRQVLSISVVGLVLCILAFAVNSPITIPLGILAALGLATYTQFKRRWWAGPFYNSWIVTVLGLMAFLAAHGGLPAEGFPTGFAPTLGCVFFGYATFVLSGYFKDIEADRATGYSTLPVVAGRRAAALVSHCFAGVAVLFAVLAVGENSAGAAPFIVGGAFALVAGEVQLQGTKRDQEAYRAILPVLHGYVLLLSGIACSRQPEWLIPLLAFYGVFTLVLSNRTEQSQV